MILKKLKEFFDQANISYEIYNHPLAYTTQQTAEKQHISGKKMAKVVMLKIDGSMAMAIVPGDRLVSLPMVKTALGCTEVRLATENEFASLFPECEIGAMPPFGNLFGLPVFVDPTLKLDESIYFNAGNHEQTVKLSYRDFEALVKPRSIPMVAEKKKWAA